MSSGDILERIEKVLRLIHLKEDADTIFVALKNPMDVCGTSETIIEKRKKYNDRVVRNEKDAIKAKNRRISYLTT